MTISRRTVMALGGAGALAAAPALAQPPAAAAAAGATPAGPGGGGPGRGPAPAPAPPSLTLPLWPGTPPGGQGRPVGVAPAGRNTVVDTPTLALYRPSNPDGSCMIICPGGGYTTLTQPLEGATPAARFSSERVTTFVLTYRLPGQNWANQADVPLQDVQRAMRIVRSRAAEFGIDAKRLGVMGFSAGGHLAGLLATRHAERVYDRQDAIDDQSAKPAFAALIYPVVTMKDPFTYKPGIPALLGANPTDAARAARSNELLVTSDTAPCFIAHGMDDTLVPVENAVLMMQALRAGNIPCETHLFQQGRHGFGIGLAGQGNELWPELFLRWMRRTAPAGA